MLNTTVGQLLVNDALPEDLRDYHRVLDKKSLSALLQQVARQHPDKYRDVSFQLNQVGWRSAQDQGGLSFGLRHLRRSKAANEIRQRITQQLAPILADDTLTEQQRNERIIRTVNNESSPQIKAVLQEAVDSGNPLGLQVLSGSRGKPMNLASLLGSDMLYTDHRDEVIPIPVLRSYSEGLTPEEYWAGTYGARRGIIATKFATQEAGFLSKQLNQAGHRLVVMGEEGDERPDAPVRGLIADTSDLDNEGALLARDTGPYKRNTPLTPKILKHLERLGKNRILIRSPLVGGSPEGGVYARDVGIRENGTLPGRGEQVGLQAAQALSEPISQGQLSAKHSGGVAGQEKAVGGFQYINQLIQVPKKMQGGAAHATVDGVVQRVEPAAAGGHYVMINDQKHYVGEGFELKIKKGDQVEAGDMLSDGIPNPALITQYKGVGEGRRYFVNEFRKAMAASGMQGHRRNIELLARGLINHVQLTEEIGDHVPDDIVPYSTLEHTYQPRSGHERLLPKQAVGQYLEAPVLHYTIGTKIRPSMLKDFDEFGVTTVPVHKNPPPFQPHMVRGMYQLQHDPDWMTQMYGSGLKKSLLESVARGGVSEERGTSFVPSLATGTDFGEVPDRAVVQPKPAYKLPSVALPETDPVLKQANMAADTLTRSLLGAGLGAGAGYLGHRAYQALNPAQTEEARKRQRNLSLAAGAGLGGLTGYLTTPLAAAKPAPANPPANLPAPANPPANPPANLPAPTNLPANLPAPTNLPANLPAPTNLPANLPAPTNLPVQSRGGMAVPPPSFAESAKPLPVLTDLPSPSSWQPEPTVSETTQTDLVNPSISSTEFAQSILPVNLQKNLAQVDILPVPLKLVSQLPQTTTNSLTMPTPMQAFNQAGMTGLETLGLSEAERRGMAYLGKKLLPLAQSQAQANPGWLSRLLPKLTGTVPRLAGPTNFALDLALPGRAATSAAGLRGGLPAVGATTLLNTAFELGDLAGLDGQRGWDWQQYENDLANRGTLSQMWKGFNNPLKSGIYEFSNLRYLPYLFR